MRDEVMHIARDPDVLGGKPHVKGHRIAVHHIASWYLRGASAEELARDYRLTPGEIHAALAYYYDHQAEIDDELAREAAEHAARAAADDSPIARRIREAIAERTRCQAHE